MLQGSQQRAANTSVLHCTEQRYADIYRYIYIYVLQGDQASPEGTDTQAERRYPSPAVDLKKKSTSNPAQA